MWNWLVHGLSAGCTLVLYDGSPLKDPAYLWTLVDDLGITLFGTSAKYIDQLSVSAPHPFPPLVRAMMNTPRLTSHACTHTRAHE